MIVYGWGTGSRTLGEGFSGRCFHCSNTRRFHVMESSRRFTLYWIPVVKWNKHYFYVCPVCSHGIELPTLELAQRILAGAFSDPTQPSPTLFEDIRKAFAGEGSVGTNEPTKSSNQQQSQEPRTSSASGSAADGNGASPRESGEHGSGALKQIGWREPFESKEATVSLKSHEQPLTQPIPAKSDPVVMRVNGTSSFLTLEQHKIRGWKKAAEFDLSNIDFRGVSFAGANLEGAKLDGSQFTGCSFHNANLKNVSARKATFDRVDFTAAAMQGADFSGSSLWEAQFVGEVNGRVSAAQIDGVRFVNCNLSRAVFSAGAIHGQLVGCSVKGADFSHSDMTSCVLWTCDFRTCRFDGTNLFAASMERCHFAGVDLSSANLVNAALTEIKVSNGTRLPAGFAIPADATNAARNVIAVAKTEAASAQSESGLWLVISMAGIIGLFCLIVFGSSSEKVVNRSDESRDIVALPAESKPISLIERSPVAQKQDTYIPQSEREYTRPVERAAFRQYSTTSEAYSSPATQTSSKTPRRLANELYGQERYAEAIVQYEKAITKNGDDWTAMNNFARLLATCPDARFRDGKRAVSIAMEVYQKNPQECTLYVIAAAYAETGNFTSATDWAYKARDVPGYDRVAIDKMLAEFRLGRACRWQGTLDRWK